MAYGDHFRFPDYEPLPVVCRWVLYHWWCLILEFIFTLALKSYPLSPRSCWLLKPCSLGMAKPETVYYETLNDFQVILLLILWWR
ncbi:MAG: hypothetical protein AB7P17_01580 [Nitrospirales bacterium]